MIEKREKLYEGKAKVLFATDNPFEVIQYFKDDATAFNGEKKGTIADKGVINNLMSCYFMERVNSCGIPNHFIKKINDREQLVRKVDIVPVEVVVRNYAAGSLVKRLGRTEGEKLSRPLIEFYYKNDALGDPLVTTDHIEMFGWANKTEIDRITYWTLRINDNLIQWFKTIGIKLVDYKLEFGRLFSTDVIVLADEISPDTCRLWDAETNKKLDKDRFRQDLGGVEEAYQEVARRLGLI